MEIRWRFDGDGRRIEEQATAGKRVVVATQNAHKVAEIMQIIDIEGYEFVPLSELGDFEAPEETGTTFAENARIKALAAHEATGLAAMADDSGIVVDALGGLPGIYSARYSSVDGEDGDDGDNNAKLLREMEGVSDRTARFTCAISFIDADGSELAATASVEGRIDDHLHGENGFGYDPLFLPDEYGGKRSMAELTPGQKNAISHRGKALRRLREMLLEREQAATPAGEPFVLDFPSYRPLKLRLMEEGLGEIHMHDTCGGQYFSIDEPNEAIIGALVKHFEAMGVEPVFSYEAREFILVKQASN